MNSSFVNATDPDCPLYEDPLWAKIIKTFAYCAMLLLALGGNILLVSVVWTQRKLRTTTNFLISNMALSDLLVPVFAMPRVIVEIHYGYRRWLVTGTLGSVLCKMVYFLQDVSTAVSVLSLSFITVDRFYAVVFPQVRTPIRGRVRVVILTIWLIAMLMHSPYFYTFQLVDYNHMTYCLLRWPGDVNALEATKAFFLTLITLLYFIPLGLIIVLQWMIVRRIRRQLLPAFTSSFRHRKRAKRNSNIVRFTLAVIVLFFLCWSPTVIYLFLVLFGDLACVSPRFRFASQFLVQSNSAMNFFIYFIFNESHRAIFRRLFCERNLIFKAFRRAASARIRTWHRTGNPSRDVSNALRDDHLGKMNKSQIELKRIRSETFDSESSMCVTQSSYVISKDTLSRATSIQANQATYSSKTTRNRAMQNDSPSPSLERYLGYQSPTTLMRLRLKSKIDDAIEDSHIHSNGLRNNNGMTNSDNNSIGATCHARSYTEGNEEKTDDSSIVTQ